MIYSVLYAHLSEVFVEVGNKVKYGEKIARMGNTGHVIPKPTNEKPNAGTHLHLSVVEGAKKAPWTLDSMVDINIPNQQECLYFLENDLFNDQDRVLVTAGWLNYNNHYAYDIIPQLQKHYDLYWNRSFTGTVAATGFSPSYGKFLIIHYDTSEKVIKQPIIDPSELEECQHKVDELLSEIEECQTTITRLNTEIAEYKNIIEAQNIERDDYLDIIKIRTEELNKAQEEIKKQNDVIFEINQKLSDIQKENNLLKTQKEKLETELSLIPSDMPKQIFECPKDGVYTINLKKGYKLFIKN